MSRLDESSDELELPDTLHPLPDTLEGCDVLEELIGLWRGESELYDLLSASGDCALGQIAIEIFVSGLQKKW